MTKLDEMARQTANPDLDPLDEKVLSSNPSGSEDNVLVYATQKKVGSRRAERENGVYVLEETTGESFPARIDDFDDEDRVNRITQLFVYDNKLCMQADGNLRELFSRGRLAKVSGDVLVMGSSLFYLEKTWENNKVHELSSGRQADLEDNIISLMEYEGKPCTLSENGYLLSIPSGEEVLKLQDFDSDEKFRNIDNQIIRMKGNRIIGLKVGSRETEGKEGEVFDIIYHNGEIYDAVNWTEKGTYDGREMCSSIFHTLSGRKVIHSNDVITAMASVPRYLLEDKLQ